MCVTKLTVSHCHRQMVTEHHLAFPVQHMPHLTHLHIDLANKLASPSPLVDFGSVPALEVLHLSQRDSSHDVAWHFRGSPASIRTLILDRVMLDVEFVKSCHNLRHLRIVGPLTETNASLLQLENLEVLELIYCPVMSMLLPTLNLPKLQHILEFVRTEDVASRLPRLPVLDSSAPHLQTVFALHSHKVKMEVGGDLESVDPAVYDCDLYTLAGGETLHHQVLTVTIQRRPEANDDMDPVQRASDVVTALCAIDSEKVFVETTWDENSGTTDLL